MQNKEPFYILFLLVTSSMMLAVKGRSQDVDHQLWMNYALTVPVNKNFSFGGDAGFRGFFSNQNWNQILIRPTATYRFNPIFSVAGAVALFSTFNKEVDNIYEFRVHQDVNVSWPDITVLSLFYRLRIEQRFFFYENLPDNFNVRIRYLIGAESMDFTLLGSKRPIYFQAIWEGFAALGKESASEIFINQARINFVFGHRISGRFRYELHYIGQRSRQFADEGLKTTQNIYRLRLFHRLTGKKY